MKRKTRFMHREKHRPMESSPIEGVANLFDVMLVFSVGLMIAVVTYPNLPELVDPTSDLTIVKNPGSPDMEIIIKKGETMEIRKLTNETTGGVGVKLGTAYLLPDGEVIFVPENVTA